MSRPHQPSHEWSRDAEMALHTMSSHTPSSNPMRTPEPAASGSLPSFVPSVQSVSDEADKHLYNASIRSLPPTFIPRTSDSYSSSTVSEEPPVFPASRSNWQTARETVTGARYFGTHYDLRPLLVRRHILMISVSGTIGMGLFVVSGQVIKIAGSAGAFLAYIFTGLIIHCVMRSLGEMVALIPEAGAIMEYPMRFVDDALGWTVAVAYWFTYAMGVTTLTTSTAILVDYWDHDVSVGWIITAVLVLVIVINIFGIRIFGEIEYTSGLLKIILVSALVILMFCINRGTGYRGPNPLPNECNPDTGPPRAGAVHGVEYWKAPFRFTPYFAAPELGGSLGRFLAVWKGMTLVSFSYIGVEIVAVTASEARFPRDDLPPASRRIFWTTFTLYLLAVFSVSLNVPHTDCNLPNIFDPSPPTATGRLSPFIIAIRNAGIDILPGFVNACLLLANWSTTNTQLYVASRTLYGMAARLDKSSHPYLTIFARTTNSGVPMTAIFASLSLSPLAYLQLGGRDPQTLLSIFSQISTVGCLVVWMAQCISFIRFHGGLSIPGSPHNRLSVDYPYASSFQPWSAYLGATGCGLLILFNGFDVFIPAIWKQHDDDGGEKEGSWFKVDLFLAAYTGVVLVGGIYAGLKIWAVRRGGGEGYKRREWMEYGVRRERFDMRRGPKGRGRLRGFLGWIFE